MAGAKGAKLLNRAGVPLAREQYCVKHDERCPPVMIMPRRRMEYHCAKGCILSKREVVLK